MKNAKSSFATRNDLAAEIREAMIGLLNQQLANLSDLYSQTKHAHWNVKGPQFWSLHKLFDELAEGVEEHADAVAERLTGLGGVAKGTIRMASASSKLAEFPEATHAGMAVVKVLADRFAAAGAAIRAAIATADEQGDADTADLFTQISRDLDQSLYFLESHLPGD